MPALILFSLFSRLHFSDPSSHVSSRLGRVRGARWLPQYDLSRFAEDVLPCHPSWTTATHACQWEGVFCDLDENVIYLNWENAKSTGFLHWSYLPNTLVELDLSFNNFFRDSGNEGTSSVPAVPSSRTQPVYGND